MIPASDTIFFVSNDEKVSKHVERILFNEFGLNTIVLPKSELAKIFFMNSPLYIIWDGRTQTQKDKNLLTWLREHFHGKAIVALLNKRIGHSDISWYQHGITMFCYIGEKELHDALTFHTQAILEHHHKKKTIAGSPML